MEQEKKEKKNKYAAMPFNLKFKAVLLIATLALLISLVVMGAVAWYTRVSNVSGITMKVAEFDFNANFQSDDFVVNAMDYTRVKDYKAAPGASGVIPIEVYSSEGAVNVDYTVALNFSDMAPEFQKRIRFYYFDSSNNQVNFNPGDPDASLEGKLTKEHPVKTEFLYWEWVYDLNQSCYFNPSTKKWVNGGTDSAFASAVVTGTALKTGDVITTTKQAINNHDDFDTEAGLGKYDKVFTSSAIDPITHQPRVYEEKLTTLASVRLDSNNHVIGWQPGSQATISAIQQAMEVRIMITGAQAKPDPTLATEPDNSHQGTSRYVNLKTFGE